MRFFWTCWSPCRKFNLSAISVKLGVCTNYFFYLLGMHKLDMDKLQELSGREIKLLSVPEQVEDSVLHYLRADGREVRPGGRRRK